MSDNLPNPVVFLVNGCIIDLKDVSTVICAREHPVGAVTCRVILRSGVSFNVDMRYSRSLIQAVEWSRSPGSVAKPRDELLDEGEIVRNSWVWN